MKSTITYIFCLLSITVIAQTPEEEYELVKLDRKVNSRYHDTAPIISPDGQTLYFFIANHPDNTFGTSNSQDIWYSEKDGSGQWKKAQRMEAPFNKNRFNQVMSISRDGNRLLIRGGSGKNKKGFSVVDRANGIWQKPIPLQVKEYDKMNIGRFSGGFLSYDGKVLIMYFSENERAKYSDLYVSFKKEGYVFTKPQPLPSNINTRLDEFGPYLTIDDKTMYFASNRPGGLGSMDIYKTTRLDDTWLKWSDPVNIGEPINTGGFDAYYSVDESGKHGFTTRTYMSADGGSMDILGVVPKPKIIPKTFVSGFVYNEKNEQPIAANITYRQIDTTQQQIESTPEDGYYEFEAVKTGKYVFEISTPGFLNASDSLMVFKTEKDTVLEKNFYLKPIEVGLTVRLDKIYFDFDKTTLRSESFEELNKVVKMMEQNPKLKIEIAGHTDSKGSDTYNQNLSQGRAEAVKDYLVTNWIPANRIMAHGYGESMPETTNETDEGRQINRRVEFKVLEN
ncbi:OmpA family protein [Fulvivirgaceae bacterium BMA12]|uniref:OmpA family protein n=1 Tax=Agaribacillus aureus TaxID=3051825 RepID=A0ABT8L767_9BACT|nr:OmpA family protein [Fulvivirgaceae bacterium BMA12]